MRRAVRLTLLVGLVGGLAACGGDDEGGGRGAEQQRGRGEAPARTGDEATGRTAGGCRRVARPPPKQPADIRRPTRPLPRAKDFSLVVTTNCGDFTIALDAEKAPKASASLVALAKADFFDRTSFHRIVPGFVIQGGDPTGTGQGGPGYSTRDRPPRDARYTRGVVAMAKTGDEPPGTAGSQFFVVTGPDAGLEPNYAVVGKVTSGLDVVDRIGNLGDASEQPTEPVVIEDVVVRDA